ncbi:MAG TPA: M13 family metallopeptidase N-terminal domain-containing protein [Acidobacteriaceae bacterium]|nr:M13 family metallopeptidase N-terminal domain-containing protein [Acidobacteriaceae bacterium]
MPAWRFPPNILAQLRGVPIENIDRTVNPYTDFDAYANGQWRATHPIPPIQVVWAIRTITQDDTLARLRSIAEDDAGKAATLPKGSPGQLTGDFYAACMDEPRINALEFKPLQPLWGKIETVQDAKALDAGIAGLQQINISAPLDLSSAQDLHDPAHVIAEIDIAGSGLPDRDYYLRDEPRFKDARERYVFYAHKMFTLAGMDEAAANRAAAAVMKIETALAQARLSRVALRDPAVQDHPMTFAELKALAPHFDWDQEFALLAVGKEGHINIPQPKLMAAFDSLLTKRSLQDEEQTCHGLLPRPI